MSKSIAAIFSRDPLREFYNLDGLTDVVLTCDVDWAPDFAIQTVLDLVRAHGFRMTVFATHRSTLLEALTDDPDIEVGLHPDFTRPHTSDWFDSKLLRLKEAYPHSLGMRSHRNFFGQNIGDLAHQADLIYDASTFLWNEPFCQAHRDYNGIVRFSYMWEDGIHLDMGLPWQVNAINLETPGLKILNVHPILLYLNSPDENHRRSVTRRYSDLASAPQAEVNSFVSSARGIRDFYTDLLAYLRSRAVRSHRLDELAALVRRAADDEVGA